MTEKLLPLTPKVWPEFSYKKNYIIGWMPDPTRNKIFEHIYPKFKDRLELWTFRQVIQERAGSKPTAFDKACLDLLDILEEELFN